jgi:hypothetical protein
METSHGRKVRNILLLIAGPLLVGGGTLLHEIYKHHIIYSPLGLVIEHLGVGFFAVVVLKLTVEEAAQMKFLGDLRGDVKGQLRDIMMSLLTKSKWILNNREVVDEIQNSLLGSDFKRPFYNLNLRLEPLENCRGLLKAWILVGYRVENVSDTEREYVVEAWLDDVIKLEGVKLQDKPGFTKIAFGSTPPLSIPELEASVKGVQQPATGGGIYSVDHMIYLKNLSTPKIKPGEYIDVTVNGMQIMRTEDHFVWNLKTITEKLHISVELSGWLTFDQLDICPREMHHIGHDEFKKTLDQPTSNKMKLDIDQVLLPFQGVEIRWAPKPGSRLATECYEESLPVRQAEKLSS